MESLYIYGAIEPGQLRLLLLLPGTSTDPIQISIIHIDFPSQTQKYEALSYVWGCMENLERIVVLSCEDHEPLGILQIGPNLAAALQRLRLENNTRALWVDSICIDQQNIPERSVQVLKMSQIYRRADKVLVWLGPEEDNSDLALSALASIATHVVADSKYISVSPKPGKDPNYSYSNHPLPFSHHQWQAIVKLLARAWFKRLWIWQEITLANSSALVVCGSQEISWSDFSSAIICIGTKNFLLVEAIGPDPLPFYENLLHTTCLIQAKRRLGIIDLLATTRRCLCIDPRDRVYATLGLQADYYPIIIRPDYSKPFKEVYRDLVIAFYETRLDLGILTFCLDTELPSWVPDWSHLKASPILTTWAAGNSKAYLRLLSEDKIEVQGVKCGVILSRLGHMPPHHIARGEMRQIVKDWMPEDIKSTTYPTGTSSFEALATLLVSNGLCESLKEDNLPTLAQVEAIFDGDILGRPKTLESGTSQYENFYRTMEQFLLGQAFFQTKDGFFGLSPASIQEGDEVYVVMGCYAPLILRPTSNSSYRVVGSCFLQGFMEGEALLGRLPPGWRIQYDGDAKRGMWFVNETTGTETREDPRLGAVPVGWNQGEFSEGQLWRAQRGISNNTTFDPRLEAVALRERGVDVQNLILI
ncbi:hypothetical protein F4821DRAFT_33309 [Hypoxylon rubiginosum]|uniref:Uncharacterized protein n=1 Tax=Hypoxylon rubiginosum TaxID=110542 RepID=A0ACC0CLE5_9PEZI|nr:hypothetical protein F4821DRAFT_33309 [Hypoxylon rubiginosum]